MPTTELTISQVAQLTGLPSSTIRYYEDKGLIRSIGRQGLKRVFHPKVIEQLALVSLGRLAGLSLDDIGAMFSDKGKAVVDRQHLLNKANEVDKTIKRLQAMRDGLRHVAHCPEENQLECPKFQKLMQKATKVTYSRKHSE